MEKSIVNKIKLIDGEALLESFKVQNTQYLPLYFKSVWKDLSRRSENSDKGFDKVIFSNYFSLPGIISTRLFTLLDSDKDDYLGYSEFSKGMNILFNSDLDSLMGFIFNIFDENNDGLISPEDIRTIFQYIPLQKSFSEQSFKDRLESQEELHDIISFCFKTKSKIDLIEFKRITQYENSTIFLYICVFLLSKKPFSERTLSFFQKETKEGLEIKKSYTQEKRYMLIASPNLASKFSPGLKILNSPLMKKERDDFKKNVIGEYALLKNKTAENGGSTLKLKISKTIDSGSGFESLEGSKILLIPTRQEKHLNEKKLEDLEIKQEVIIDKEFLDGLNSNIEKESNDEVTHEGYLMKLVDDKLRKLWFTLFEKYLYCK